MRQDNSALSPVGMETMPRSARLLGECKRGIEMAKVRTKLTQVEKNHIHLVNKLSASFRRAFPGLKNNPKFAPIIVRDIERQMREAAKK